MNIRITPRTELRVWHLIGPNAAAELERAGLPRPPADLTATAADDTLVACTGADQYLIVSAATPAFADRDAGWLFSRSDLILAIEGADSFALLAQFCAYDFRGFAPGQWLMARLAGVDCWLYGQTGDDEIRLLLGCDPSHGRYLHTTLTHAMSEHSSESTQPRGFDA